MNIIVNAHAGALPRDSGDVAFGDRRLWRRGIGQ